MPPTRRDLLAVAASSIALAGCAGDGGGTDTPAGGATPTPTDTPTRTPTDAPTDATTATPAPGDGATPTPTPTPAAPDVQVATHPDLGDVLVDGGGMTLYMFDADERGSDASACTGDCVDAWPPLTVEGDPTAGDGVTAELATFERSDGSTQVTANGWPLYYFSSDEESGDVTGQGVQGVWWVLRPDGTPVRADGTPTPTPSPAPAADVRVRTHPDLGEILVDGEGMTLYMFDSDEQGSGESTCSGNCAGIWPPLTVGGDPASGGDVTAELTTFERSDGSTQAAANGWPLYYYASDEEPGDATGQGVQDVWWVLRPDGTPVRESATPTPDDTPTSTPDDTPTPTDTPDDGGPVY